MAFQISRAIDAHQIGYAVAGACALFVVLLLIFELLRTRLYWLYALALVLFFGGWLAWKNDLNGTWCFRRNSPFYWLQGHAVWHVLTMGALACIYWFFRSERLVD